MPSCSAQNPQPPQLTNSENILTPAPAPKIITVNPGWQKNLMVDDVPYDLYIPKNYRDRSILVLPGWNFPRTSWIENSDLVTKADQYGYALILPEMLQTLYESSYYPETNLKWNQVPGGKFMKERFIPTIQTRHHLLTPGSNNTLLGLSTGGRGVALVALENPGLFVAGASLSGDFSQENTPDDRLMTGVYGSYESFRERWLGRDNPMSRVSEWTIPLYLAHGIADDIVPESQSRLFYQALIKSHSGLQVEYHPVPDAGHNYTFWSGQLPAVFNFFDKIIGQK